MANNTNNKVLSGSLLDAAAARGRPEQGMIVTSAARPLLVP